MIRLTPTPAASDDPPLLAAQYVNKFTLNRPVGVCPLHLSENWWEECGRYVWQVWISKMHADAKSAVVTSVKRGRLRDAPDKNLLRRLAITLAPLYPLEEWACVFPDAVVAGDTKFIEKIITAYREPKPLPVEYVVLCIFWHGFHAAGHEAKATIPPLKFWSDEAAWQFVCFQTGNAELTLPNYQQIKSRAGLRSDKPVLVGYASYSRERTTERLKCSRR